MIRVRSIIISALLLLCVCFSAVGQRLPILIPYKTKNGWGYSDSNGSIKIKPQYYEAGAFIGGKAIVSMYDDSCNFGCDYTCLIDQQGQFIIPPSYHWNGQLSYTLKGMGLNVHDRNNNWGIVNADGKLIIPFIYENRFVNYGFDDPVGDGQWFLVVYKNGKAGVIDTLNNTLVPFIYTGLEPLPGYTIKLGPIFVAVRYGLKGLVRLGGRELIQVRYNYVQMLGNTPYVVAQEMGKDGKTGVIDTFGTVIVPFEYQQVFFDYNLIGGSFQVRTDKGYGCYDAEKNKIIIPTIYDELLSANNGYIVGVQYQNPKTMTAIDESFYRRKSYETISQFTLMNEKGKVLIQPKYNMISVLDDSIVVWRDMKYEEHLEGDIRSYYTVALDKQSLKPLGEWRFISNVINNRRGGYGDGGTNYGNRYEMPKPHIDSGITPIYNYSKGGRQWKVTRYIAIDSNAIGLFDLSNPHVSNIAVETDDTGEKLYAVVDNDRNYIFAPRPEYEFMNGSYKANWFIVRQSDKYAVVDKQLRNIIPPVPAKLTKFFKWKDKAYAFGLSCPIHGSDIKERDTRCCDRTYNSLFNSKGKAIKGFEKYQGYKFFDTAMKRGQVLSSDLFRAEDDSGKVVFVNLEGGVVFPEISFKYDLITYHGNDYFLCGNRVNFFGGDIDYKLVNSLNKEYVPGMKVKQFGKYQLSLSGEPILKTGMEDLYTITYIVGREQKTVFMNSQGKVFADIDVLLKK